MGYIGMCGPAIVSKHTRLLMMTDPFYLAEFVRLCLTTAQWFGRLTGVYIYLQILQLNICRDI